MRAARDSIAVRSAEPSPSRCSCPTNSSSVRGRIRAASGASAAGTRVRPRLRRRRCRRGVVHRALSMTPRPRSAPPTCVMRSDGAAEGLRREAVELLQRLIRFNTVNPPGNEREAQELLAELLERRRLRVRAARGRAGAPEPRRPAARRARRARRWPALRTSTPCPPTPAEWTRDPWGGDVADGCVWGRGALDMKAQVAAEVAAASRWRASGWRPARGELLRRSSSPTRRPAATLGAQWLCEEQPEQGAQRLRRQRGRRRGRSSSAAGASTRSASARRGSSASSCAPAASPGHASMPGVGDNALLKLAPLLERLAEQPPPEPTPDRRVPRRAARRASARRRRRPRRRARARCAPTEPLLADCWPSRCSA